MKLGEDAAFRAQFFRKVGEVADIDGLDGVRVALLSGETVHYRASGNAPELRCYVEAASADAAGRLLDWALSAAATAVGRSGSGA